MIKTIVKDGYTVEYIDTDKYTDEEINQMIDDAINIVRRKEEAEDATEPRLIHKEGRMVEEGDEVIDFRGDKAIVTGWEAPRFEGKSGRVYVEEILKDGNKFRAGYYPEVYDLHWINLPWGKKEVQDIFEPISTFKSYEFLDKTKQGSEVVRAYRDLKDDRMHVIVHRNSDDTYIIALGYNPDDGTWNQGRYDFKTFEEAEKALMKDYRVEEFERKVEDTTVKDVPVNAPEEKVNIAFNEKLKGGKNALTYGMIEEAFKNRGDDEGKTFKAYIDVVLDSLREDIKNAEYIVSGEMKPVRKLLLEDYIKIESLLKKAGMTEELAEMQALNEELSDKLKLNYFKKPKFKKSEMRSAAKELRNAHRYDSTITKKIEPVFLCSKSDLTASYNDAKQGKLPEVFEGNLKKVEKDIMADYNRINQGLDHYLEDPRIVKVLPEIIQYYELARGYAKELGYEEIADRFGNMLVTIRKGWGLE